MTKRWSLFGGSLNLEAFYSDKDSFSLTDGVISLGTTRLEDIFPAFGLKYNFQSKLSIKTSFESTESDEVKRVIPEIFTKFYIEWKSDGDEEYLRTEVPSGISLSTSGTDESRFINIHLDNQSLYKIYIREHNITGEMYITVNDLSVLQDRKISKAWANDIIYQKFLELLKDWIVVKN